MNSLHCCTSRLISSISSSWVSLGITSLLACSWFCTSKAWQTNPTVNHLFACVCRYGAHCCAHLGCPASPRGSSVSSTAAGCCLWAAPERAHTTGPECLCYNRLVSPLHLNWPAQKQNQCEDTFKKSVSYRWWRVYTLKPSLECTSSHSFVVPFKKNETTPAPDCHPLRSLC